MHPRIEIVGIFLGSPKLGVCYGTAYAQSPTRKVIWTPLNSPTMLWFFTKLILADTGRTLTDPGQCSGA